MVLPPQTSPDTVTPCESDEYYFDEQLRRYIIQFMAVFAGFWVKVGASAGQQPRLIRVPIAYGSRDRVVAWIKGSQTQNNLMRLPMFSAFLRNVQPAPDKRKGVGQVRRQTVARTNGEAFPNNIEVVRQLMPVPYRATFELNVFASNALQHHQIMEQIMVLFDPILQLQTSDDPLDWTQITTVEMMGIQWEENFPAGGDRRIIQTVINFDVIFYLSGPAEYKNNFIKNIKVRLAVVPTTANLNDSYSVLNALDTEGAAYIDLFSLDNIDIEKP